MKGLFSAKPAYDDDMVNDDANNNTNKKKSEKNLLDFFQTFVSKITDVHDFYDQTNVLFTLRT